ncbi:MAG: hypothetical protein U0R52_13525 [Solirubrobacterales bacterium]
MNDDWRLTIELEEHGLAHGLAEDLDAGEIEHDLKDSFGDRVIVTHDGPNVFLYAADREQAEKAEKMVRDEAGKYGWDVRLAVERWHPDALAWEDPDKPLPASPAGEAEEHEELIAEERSEAVEHGYPEWEVRVDLPSHHDAVALSRRLDAEGLQNVRRWKYLVVGAIDEDGAEALAERLREEAPEDSDVKVEGTFQAARHEAPPNPFAVLGGLGG